MQLQLQGKRRQRKGVERVLAAWEEWATVAEFLLDISMLTGAWVVRAGTNAWLLAHSRHFFPDWHSSPSGVGTAC